MAVNAFEDKFLGRLDGARKRGVSLAEEIARRDAARPRRAKQVVVEPTTNPLPTPAWADVPPVRVKPGVYRRAKRAEHAARAADALESERIELTARLKAVPDEAFSHVQRRTSWGTVGVDTPSYARWAAGRVDAKEIVQWTMYAEALEEWAARESAAAK